MMLAGVCWFKSHALEKKCYDVMWINLMYSKVPHTILNSGLSRQDWLHKAFFFLFILKK